MNMIGDDYIFVPDDCLNCVNYYPRQDNWNIAVCNAFPNGMPQELIQLDQTSIYHLLPFEDQGNDLTFIPIEIGVK